VNGVETDRKTEWLAGPARVDELDRLIAEACRRVPSFGIVLRDEKLTRLAWKPAPEIE
jgi:hypothetical protein